MIIFTAFKMLLAILLGVIYLPLNMLNNWLAAQMIKSWKGDKILFFLYGIVFLPTWALAAIFSIPYEKLVESAH